MGLKLQGIIINENFETKQNELFELLGIETFKLINKSTLNDYWNGFQSKGKIVFSFFKNATIIRCDSHFISSDPIKSKLSKNHEIMTFYQFDTINAMSFDFFRNSKPIRRLYTDHASKYFKFEEGQVLPEENNPKSVDDSFYNLTIHFLTKRIDSKFVHDPSNSFEYEIKYTYPGFIEKLMGKTKYHNYWKRTF
ncbi:hypothetical protein [Flavivirga eckloniae]|uniref:Uncharacterized protein n=1 Tax=Flavivirga eckloniae TaxID=1803846 RepID=A0A2K9PW44_9FLAO|nr:hypothetical protein [Flavivirga eckloniae]AUP81291.1 hypothetical protein C1H87_22250 [Flavivirga eckloniae]